MSQDDLGDRMKVYEGAEAQRRAMPWLPVLIRVDGKCFSSWTRGLVYPFDERLERLRVLTTTALVQELGACIGFHQSDEISLVLAPHAGGTVYTDGRFQKLVSHAASIATATWNYHCREILPEKSSKPAIFDARAWAVPSREEAVNALIWREWDATKNSISMAARAHFSHKQVFKKSQRDMLDMLHGIGVDWATAYPAWAKRGTYVGRRTFHRKLTEAELEALPPKHDARKDPDLVFSRSVVQTLDLPMMSKIINRVDVVFSGAEPVSEFAASSPREPETP